MFLHQCIEIFSQQNFLPSLKDHLLGRIIATPPNGFTDLDRQRLLIYSNRIYFHKTLRINFTTYDCRRDQDVINPQRQSDIMVLADPDDEENTHPYYYAHVIGIFHSMVRQMGTSNIFKRMDFLWVRWYGFDTKVQSGFKARRLCQIGFLDSTKDAYAFGFIDPDDVIRAIHLIPRFQLGKTSLLLPPSMARHEDEEDEDYLRYYIAMYVSFSRSQVLLITFIRFVDRDMFARFGGLGPGLKAVRSITASFRDDLEQAFGSLQHNEDGDAMDLEEGGSEAEEGSNNWEHDKGGSDSDDDDWETGESESEDSDGSLDEDLTGDEWHYGAL